MPDPQEHRRPVDPREAADLPPAPEPVAAAGVVARGVVAMGEGDDVVAAFGTVL